MVPTWMARSEGDPTRYARVPTVIQRKSELHTEVIVTISEKKETDPESTRTVIV